MASTESGTITDCFKRLYAFQWLQAVLRLDFYWRVASPEVNAGVIVLKPPPKQPKARRRQ